MNIIKAIAVLGLMAACALGRAETPVTVFTYNDRTPFVVDSAKQEGLEYRLCDWLTKESKGQYRFTLKITSATEVRTHLEAGTLKGILIGVNAGWFSEAVQKKVLWTPPILFDKNIVLSLTSKKVNYSGPASLHGVRVAVVKSWFYPEFGSAFTNGKILRADFATEPLALKAVAEGKAEVAVVSEWTYLYEQLRGDLQGDFFTADQPADTFTRNIAVPASEQSLYDFLGKTLTNVKQNSGWQEATSL